MTETAWLRRSAGQGSPKAQSLLGIAYEQGAGTEQSDAESLAWYMKAVNCGNADAQGNVGRMFPLV